MAVRRDNAMQAGVVELEELAVANGGTNDGVHSVFDATS
jgi:hypothetical protein